MYFANLLTLVGIAAQAALITLLARRRIHRLLPVFFYYIVWGVAGDSVILILRFLNSRALYPYEIQSYIDLLVQYSVLIELAWSSVRPIRRSLPKGFLLGISLTIAAGAALAWPLSGIRETLQYPHQFLLALHAQRAFAILRIVFLLVIACCSNLLRINWHDRELQVATGLGFYSLVSLAGAMVHSHQSFGWRYFYVDVAVACSYLLSLGYWIMSFAQKESARHDFTPEMKDSLLAVANLLRRQRGSMSAADNTRA